MNDIKIKKGVDFDNGKPIIKVYAPYNTELIKRFKMTEGQWDSESKYWKFSPELLSAVRDILKSVFGYDDTADIEMYDVKFTMKEGLYERCDSVKIMGKIVAQAHGRDSGAEIGKDVNFVEGAPTSGGSMKNWSSEVPAGSVFILRNVPKPVYDKEYKEYEDVADIEILSRDNAETLPDEDASQITNELKNVTAAIEAISAELGVKTGKLAALQGEIADLRRKLNMQIEKIKELTTVV